MNKSDKLNRNKIEKVEQNLNNETDRKFKSNLNKIKNLEKNLTNVSFDIFVFHAGYTP